MHSPMPRSHAAQGVEPAGNLPLLGGDSTWQVWKGTYCSRGLCSSRVIGLRRRWCSSPPENRHNKARQGGRLDTRNSANGLPVHPRPSEMIPNVAQTTTSATVPHRYHGREILPMRGAKTYRPFCAASFVEAPRARGPFADSEN
jgi:hypothetical protein